MTVETKLTTPAPGTEPDMDPVETLRELRETGAALQAIFDAGDDPEEIEISAQRMVELFNMLDEWMSGVRNGYSPWDTERDRANRAGMPQGVQVGNGNTQVNTF